MKSVLWLIFFIILSLPAYAEDLRVAVIDFKADGVDAGTASRVTELINSEMIKSGKFKIIERSQIDRILTEQGFQLTGCTDNTCAVEVGKLLSANKMLIGSVLKIGDRIIITGRIVDVQTGSAEFSADAEAKTLNDLSDSAKKFARTLAGAVEKKQIVQKISSLEESRDLKFGGAYNFFDFIGFSPTYFSGGKGARYGWNVFTLSFGNRIFEIGTTVIKSDGINKTMFPVTVLIPIYLFPNKFSRKGAENKAEITGFYFMGEWAYMDKKIRNFETKPYYSGRLLWDIAVLFSVFAGVSYDDERRFYAGVSLKAGVGMYSSNPFF